MFELCGTRESSRKCHCLVTLGDCYLLNSLEIVDPWSTSKRLWRCPGCSCESLCALHARVVKSNSSGIEVQSGYLFLMAQYQVVPQKRSGWTLDPPQCELRWLASHWYRRIKSLSHVRLFLELNLHWALYILEIELLHINLGCKPTPSDHSV